MGDGKEDEKDEIGLVHNSHLAISPSCDRLKLAGKEECGRRSRGEKLIDDEKEGRGLEKGAGVTGRMRKNWCISKHTEGGWVKMFKRRGRERIRGTGRVKRWVKSRRRGGRGLNENIRMA